MLNSVYCQDVHGELRPRGRHVVLVEDRLDRARRLAGPAAHALVGVDRERPGSLVEAADQTLLGTGPVKVVDARSAIT
jgi:hypothetical protein